jgi:hypothetical protein
MQFLLLLPQLPHARDSELLDRGVSAGRSDAVRRGRTLILSMVDAIRRRLGMGHRGPALINPHKS